jgi:hypothetical protein
MNLDTFEVIDAVIHDVPQGGSGEPVRLTDAPIDLDPARGVEVIVDPDGAACVREAVRAIIADASEIVAASQRVAEHLDDVQTGRNSAGLLTVILGTLDRQPCVAVLKLEREQGLRFNIQTDAQGRNTVDLELLRELTLTDKTKVFKTSLFQLETPGDPASLVGRVADDQRDRYDGIGVANFYLAKFLGCQLKASPAKTTLTFVQTLQSFINDHVANPETKGRYQIAMLAEMQSNTMDLRPRDFAQGNLDPGHDSEFLQAIRDLGMDPTVAFEKDTSLVKVQGFKISFAHGMVLVGSTEDLDERVRLRPPEADVPGLDVDDAIKRLAGR